MAGDTVAVCEICRRLGRREPGDLSRTDGAPVFMVPVNSEHQFDKHGAAIMRQHLDEHDAKGER